MTKSKHNFVRPDSLDSGSEYLLLEQPARMGMLTQPVMLSLVTFVAYDVCPALAIVRNGSGRRWRCERGRLFIPENSIPPSR